MLKPKLLDLFCGAGLLRYDCCGIIRIWLQLHVNTVEGFLNHREGLVNIVQWLVRIILTGQQKRHGLVVNAAKIFLLRVLQMPIGNIALKPVLRKQILKELSSGIRNILILCHNIIKLDWLRIRVRGETKLAMNALNLSVYWGANV